MDGKRESMETMLRARFDDDDDDDGILHGYSSLLTTK